MSGSETISSSMSSKNSTRTEYLTSDLLSSESIGSDKKREKDKRLTKIEVNRLIQPKFCKIITKYREGTGYIVDEKEGILVTSFHIFGIKSEDIFPKLNISSVLDDKESEASTRLSSFNKSKKNSTVSGIPVKIINELLYLNGYVDKSDQDGSSLSNGYNLSKKALMLTSKDELELIIDKDWLEKELREMEVKSTDFMWKDVSERRELISDILKNKDAIERDSELINKIFTAIRQSCNEKLSKIRLERISIYWMGMFLEGEIHIPNDDISLLMNYAAYDAFLIKIALRHGLFYEEEFIQIDVGDKIEFFNEEKPLLIGEALYFGGYPLNQSEYTFSVGIVSSVNSNHSIQNLIIEGAVAPGNSGSPVFIQRNGKVYCIGIITGVISHLLREVCSYREKLMGFKSISSLDPIVQSTSDDIEDVSSNVEELSSYINSATYLLIRAHLANLSTGKGRVILLKSVEDLTNQTLLNRIGLLKKEIDLLAPNEVPSPVKPKISLWQYVNQNNGGDKDSKDGLNTGKNCRGKLTLSQLIDYIKQNSDLTTGTIILSDRELQKIDEEKTCFIFPPYRLSKNIPAKLLRESETGWDVDTGWRPDKVVVNYKQQSLTTFSLDPEEMKRKDRLIIIRLYDLACQIGDGRLHNAQQKYVDEKLTDISKGHFFTEKFHTDHIAKKDFESGREIAERRLKKQKISTSTTLKDKYMEDIDEEVKASQVFYKKASDFLIELIKNMKQGRIIKHLLFRTEMTLKLETYSEKKQEPKVKRGWEPFYYGVIEKNAKFYMHHFAGDKPIPDFEEKEFNEEKRSFYYKLL